MLILSQRNLRDILFLLCSSQEFSILLAVMIICLDCPVFARPNSARSTFRVDDEIRAQTLGNATWLDYQGELPDAKQTLESNRLRFRRDHLDPCTERVVFKTIGGIGYPDHTCKKTTNIGCFANSQNGVRLCEAVLTLVSSDTYTSSCRCKP